MDQTWVATSSKSKSFLLNFRINGLYAMRYLMTNSNESWLTNAIVHDPIGRYMKMGMKSLIVYLTIL